MNLKALLDFTSHVNMNVFGVGVVRIMFSLLQSIYSDSFHPVKWICVSR